MFRPHVIEAWCLGHGFLKKSMIELNDLPKSGGEGEGTISPLPPYQILWPCQLLQVMSMIPWLMGKEMHEQNCLPFSLTMTYVNASAIWIGKLEWNCVRGLLINDLWYVLSKAFQLFHQRFGRFSQIQYYCTYWRDTMTILLSYHQLGQAGVCCGSCNPSNYREADI